MEYGRLVVLGYSSYRVASTGSGRSTVSEHGVARSPPGKIGAAGGARSLEKDRRVIGQLWEPIGDQNAQYVLVKRRAGNGVRLSRFHHFYDARLREASDEKATAVGADAAAAEASPQNGKADLKTVTRRMMHAIEIRNKALSRSSSQRDASSEEDSEEVVSPSSSASSAASLTEHQPPKQSAPATSYLMCVPMNDVDAHASVTEYVDDDATDMFQIGRMPCRQNDVVIPGPRVGASGTISRFAARILCSREPPYECRIYAGGFDVGRKMTTAGHALKRCGVCAEWLKRVPADHKCIRGIMDDGRGNQSENDKPDARDVARGLDIDHVEMDIADAERVPIDGLTKNGVRVWLPERKQWFEVSVNGNMYAIAPRTPSASSLVSGRSSSLNPDMSVRHSAFNRPTGGVADVPAVLADGAIIDLGGVQLQFQAPRRNQHAPSDGSAVRGSMVLLGDLDDGSDSSVASKLEKLNVHCPVQLHPLRFHRDASDGDIESDQVPHVFPACGHVFGYEKRIAKSKTCPLCRKPGNFVRLLLKENFQLQSRAEQTAIPECVFNPCGHAISSKLADHYSALLMPNGRAICPFCAVHLDAKTPFSRLYLYSESDGETHGAQAASSSSTATTTTTTTT